MSPAAPRRPWLAAAGAALFTLTAVLVAAGSFTRVDQFAVSHLMPWLQPGRRSAVTLASLTVPDLHGPLTKALLELWTYPAAFVPSLALVVVCARRVSGGAVVMWSTLWLAGNATELAGKSTITRPALVKAHAHAAMFDGSLPSGHTIRALLVAGVVVSTWRHGWLALVWAATVPCALVVIGAHVPTDIVAGLFVTLALAAWAPLGRAPRT